MFPLEEGSEGNRDYPLVKSGGTPIMSHIIRFPLICHSISFEKLYH